VCANCCLMLQSNIVKYELVDEISFKLPTESPAESFCLMLLVIANHFFLH